ncbi:MarR family transcriptional regulator [Patulibacter sp. SYSU D01012]|uniref:MarR family winged helix-turn-helix transcriptional regulator n=1 Tax=Patulibacter sp. SYSU D01012 TaxID=2817381 RepID=UPI001B317028|nr:MarR family transcriptional regulator [Patulibacter sp. SYSU D01012]
MPETADEPLTGRHVQMVGAARAAGWSADETGAWEGLIRASAGLRAGLTRHLEATHALSPSALGLLGRLLLAEDGRLRLSALADDAGLSLSRVSRIVDALEGRGLVERRPCPGDARAINAHVTPAGRALAEAAQADADDWLQERFFARLDEEETATLARIMARFAGGDPAPCDGASAVPAPRGAASCDGDAAGAPSED